MENKKMRLYAPSQKHLNIIKKQMKVLGLKSNNTTAVNYAVDIIAKEIEAELKEFNKK